MSRGIRDLRELVVVSRLSYKESDSDSDGGRAGLITPFESVDAHSYTNDFHCSVPDSSSTPPSSADSGIGRKKKRKKPKGYSSTKNGLFCNSKVFQSFPFPKTNPLPALGKSAPENGCHSGSSSSRESLVSQGSDSDTKRDFTTTLRFLDEQTVADWLQRANQHLKELTEWCTDVNWVNFAQFWIKEFGVQKRCEILELENSILLDELTLALHEGLEKKKIQHKDVSDLQSALFREYPKKLTESVGVYLFLDYLDVFTSERALEYRNILSDVRLSSSNKQHIQLILASRCFMLISVWMAIVKFYRQVSVTPSGALDPSQTHREKGEVHYHRLQQAISLGLLEVVHYFLFTGKVSAGHVDSRQKTLLHMATSANQPKIVEYLLKKWTGCIDVNRPCDTGNSPLHVAVNLGSLPMVQLLLNMPDIDVNIPNKQCNGATPLHLSAVHGHVDIFRILLKRKADTRSLMAGQTALQVAKDFGHLQIAEILSADFT